MVRPPNPKSKTIQIVVKGSSEWEAEIRAFKELCARNGINMSQEIYNRAIKTFLRDHHWPPGNSQTLVDSFIEKPEITCDWCSNPPEEQVHLDDKLYRLCSGCRRDARRKPHKSFGYNRL